ncbi:MAG: hypothetical protein CL807_03900 [Citromicrobium sp.]|nr:hypothetical protein [Citromicrobium sp.]MAO95336.1 hypothetical protein [Citromicrobium sp.]MAS85015.1 hypothetical protein [Erythrobacteraceae bacterium]MBD76039.1 hypothetical protein [Citromicrobium sp.]MBT45637.1 hypothetical protein [Citromicrobium sp.]
MIAFLRSTKGRWTIRLLALGVSFLFATRVMGMAWNGDGHAVLVVIFAIVLLGFAYAIDIFVGVALSFAPQPAGPATKMQFEGAIPPLSQAKQAKVRKLVGQMAEAGVFAPETPDPSLAFAAFAVDRQPVDWVGVLQSLAEADYYHPGCDPERWSDNLAWGELPADWRAPGEGRVLAVLWEDETVIFSRVWSRSLAGLTAPMGKAEPWTPVDEEVLQALRDARISIG